MYSGILRFILPGIIYLYLYACSLQKGHKWIKILGFSILLVVYYLTGYYEGIKYGLEAALG